jgi:cytidylate kinase
MRPPRSIDELVEEQAHRWGMNRMSPVERVALQPVVAISRQHGAGGEELARRLAQSLHLDLFDSELIHRIADSVHLSDRLVQTLDERDREALTDLLLSIGSPEYLSTARYREHLAWVVGTIARHGGAVILGRGAHVILRPGEALRVRVTAPLDARVKDVMRREGVDAREARRRNTTVEAERRAFLRRHFRADVEDMAHFDMMVNTGALGLDEAEAAIRAALQALEGRRPT